MSFKLVRIIPLLKIIYRKDIRYSTECVGACESYLLFQVIDYGVEDMNC